MSNDNKKNKPLKEFKFKFNFYWVYGILFALILGYQFFNSASATSNELSTNEFETILKDNDIQKIIIANKDVAQVFITPEALQKEKHKKNTLSPFYNDKNPMYLYKIGDLKNFEDSLEQYKEENSLTFDTKNDTQERVVVLAVVPEGRSLILESQKQSFSTKTKKCKLLSKMLLV